MNTAVDAVLEIFSWVGLASSVFLGVVAIILWAADGTWLPADAVVDHEDDLTYVRWFDGDGEANSARADAHTAEALRGEDSASIWYRHGWSGRMRLTRRPPGLKPVILLAVGMLVLGAVCLIASLVLLFTNG